MVQLHKFWHQFLPPGNKFTMALSEARKDYAYQYLSQLLVDTNLLNQGVIPSTRCLISIYNFEAVSPTHENCSSCPALCCLLSEKGKRYVVPVVPEVKVTPSLSKSSRPQKLSRYYMVFSKCQSHTMIDHKLGNPMLWHNDIHCCA